MKIKMKSTKEKLIVFCLYIMVVSININCAGCPYSFTGSSVPSHLKTIGIALFDDQSNFGEPGLREKVTKALTDKFLNDNSLTVTDKNRSDAVLEGSIIRITDKAAVVSGDEQVNKRRIEVTVKATYTDMIKKKKIYDKEFTNWGEYLSSGNTYTQRQEGLNSAIEKITEDILLQTVSGW
jgi:hypothetical protein